MAIDPARGGGGAAGSRVTAADTGRSFVTISVGYGRQPAGSTADPALYRGEPADRRAQHGAATPALRAGTGQCGIKSQFNALAPPDRAGLLPLVPEWFSLFATRL